MSFGAWILFNLAFQPVHFAVNMAAGETHKAEVCDQFNPQSKAAGPQAEMQTEKGGKKRSTHVKTC